MNILEVTKIIKHYGPVRALQNVSFAVPEGSTFGILGPNGSGKTTLLGIVMGITNADSGHFTLFEDETTPAGDLRKRVGTLLETPNFYHYLSAVDNLKIAAEIKGVQPTEIDDVLRKVGLYPRRFSKFSTFSLGMKQRLGIATALLGNPKVLVLDEPTNGLDPEGIAEIRTLIKELGASGHTIIMASHLLDEVEKVCSHVAILKSGTLLAAGKSDDILADGDILEISARDIEKLHEALKTAYPGNKITREGNALFLYFPSNNIDTETFNRWCFSAGIVLTKLVLKKKSLESMFLELVSNPSSPR